ncbi:MAG: phage virion morphogenesis protein [Firmicutes bacterium]|nr:phage virion morphogenesis protein [Bacillota bacterium]
MAVQIIGDWSRFEGCLQRLVGFDFVGLHKEIGEQIVTATEARFRQGVGPDGKKWPESMRAKAEHGQTLVKTKRLMASLSYHATASEVAVGTNVVYAGVHQTGAKIQAKRSKYLRFRIGRRWAMKRAVEIPARPFMGINDDDKTAIQEIIQKRIAEATR